MANGDGVSIEAQRNSAWTCIPGRLCGGGEYVKTLADEIERLTTENGELDACATDYRHEIDRLKIEHGDMNLANVEYEKEIERLTAECSDYKRAAIDAESRLIDLTEELLRRGKENGAIGWPQIRRMVERASVSGSQPPHGAAITMDDGGKVRTILDDAADQRPTTLHDDRCLVHKGADCNCALAALDARRQEQE